MSEFTITVEPDGEKFTVSGDATILEAAESAGIDLDFGCRHGACSVCKTKIVSGEADQSEGDALTDEELEEGYLLVCIGRPKSDMIIRAED